MIGALLAQGLGPFDAARLGVYLHGASGEGVCLLEFTDRRMLEKQQLIRNLIGLAPLDEIGGLRTAGRGTEEGGGAELIVRIDESVARATAAAGSDAARTFLHEVEGGHWLNADNPDALVELLTAALPE